MQQKSKQNSNSNSSTILWLLGIAGLGSLGYYFYNLKVFSDNIVSNFTVKNKKLITGGVAGLPTGFSFDLIVTLKNPTDKQLTIKHPVLKLYARKEDDNAFLVTDPLDKDYNIEPYSTKTLEPISINIDFASIALRAKDIVKDIRKNQRTTAYVETVTQVDGQLTTTQKQSLAI